MTISPVRPAGQVPSGVVADAELDPRGHPAGGAELVGPEAVAGDHGSGFGQPIALEHGDAQGVEELLKLDVEQGAAADEKLEPAAEILPDLAEQELVVEGEERLFQPVQAPAPVHPSAL